jgi:hypothetical protein
MKAFLESFDFLRMKPSPETVKGGAPKDVTVYVLAEPGRQYALFLRKSAGATLELDLPMGTYDGLWLIPVTGETTAIARFNHTGGTARFIPPQGSGDVALRLVAR